MGGSTHPVVPVTSPYIPQTFSKKAKNAPTCMSPSQLNDEALQFHWKTFPPPAKEFILSTLDNLSLKKLVDFWKHHAEYTSGSVAGGIYGASWYLALVYLNRNELAKARSLTLNGSFLQECYYSGFDRVANMCTRGTIEAEQLPHFFAGFNATRSTAGLYSFLQRSLPQEYQQMLASFVNMGTKSRVMNFVGSVSQDWERKSFNKSSSLRSSSTRSNDPEDDDITLVIGGCSFRVCPSLPLKSVFNEYADNNSVSLKSLRFSYAGKTLFLSTAGRKSPNELGMLDNDTIEVHNSVQETAVPATGDNDKQNTNQQSKKKQKKSKKTKAKSKNGSYKIEIVKSDEEHKEKHSKILTKLFEEADPKFKMIRQQLNAQNLFKQQPKTKTLKNLKQQDYCYHYSSFNPGVGGKAGKTRFLVNVGEVAHLYKSSKSVASLTTSTIDLHGCTQEEAISKLDAGLKEWNERAMLGSYPFVHPVSIVCGAGGQVLSETVEKWIGKQPNVANVPRARQRYATSA